MSEYRSASEQRVTSGQRPPTTRPAMGDMPADTAGRRESPWAAGFAIFAGVMMMTIGIFHAIAGLAAILKQEFFVVTKNYLFEFNTVTWGWIHLLLGIAIAISGFFVFSGAAWARAVGITMAALSAVGNFLFLPYYPVWSVLIIAIDVTVIWALSVYGRDAATRGGTTAYDRGAADASYGTRPPPA